MSYFLHIETATNICSVAVSQNDKIIAIIEEPESLKNSEIITIQIINVLKKAKVGLKDLSAVALSEGPGSYTSLRVGMSAAKAICYGHNLPLISINTLESLAYMSNQVQDANILLCSMIDARRMEVYASLFNSSMEPIFENTPIVLDENSFQLYFDKGYRIIFSGNGVEKTKSLFKANSEFTNIKCSAQNLVDLTLEKFDKKQFEDIAYFSPNYIKPPNITTPKVKRL
jgi:tRNA threonylcarbamoyladenosine biosynthesis protein TsaB